MYPYLQVDRDALLRNAQSIVEYVKTPMIGVLKCNGYGVSILEAARAWRKCGVIGKLERILTVILVLCNEIGAIGFVLTAKSIARYKQLDNQSFAEKYLVGTLSSTAIAIIAALLLK